jgi:hypothetical protein
MTGLNETQLCRVLNIGIHLSEPRCWAVDRRKFAISKCDALLYLVKDI